MKKARVKKTGEIVHVDYVGGVNVYVSEDYVEFDPMELEFDVDASPDYWDKLLHQYAGMAMQGILSNNELLTALCNGNKDVPISEIVANNANFLATALVEKLKGESNEKKRKL